MWHLLYLASLLIYCSKNEEYCLDIASLECLRHITIDPQSRLSIPGPRSQVYAHVSGPRSHVSILTILYDLSLLGSPIHTRTRPFFVLFDSLLLWTLSKFKPRLQSCGPSYSASATKSPSFDRSSQPGHLRSRKPPSQILRSLVGRHTSLIHGSRQLEPSYRSTA